MVGHGLELQLHLILVIAVWRILLFTTEKPVCEKVFHSVFQLVSSFIFITWLDLLLHFNILCLLV